jgi:hypothetical protein
MREATRTVVVETKRGDGGTERIEIGSVGRNSSSPTPDDLGLKLAEAKELLLKLQSFLAQDLVRQSQRGRQDVPLRINAPTA